MRRTSVVKVVAVAVLASLALAPMSSAQQPAQQQQPTQPDLYQDTLKGQRASDRSQGFYEASAVVANAFVVPGKVITCAAGAIVGVGMLAITFGSGYKYFAGVLDEGCGGKWVVNADDMRPDRPAAIMDWEQRPPR